MHPSTTPARETARAIPARRLEITRRGRVVLLIAAFVVGLLVAVGALLALDVPSALAGGESSPATVTVAEGDTLWGYAAEHAPEGMSTSSYVTAIRAENHLPTGRLTVGQEIVLPQLG